MSSMTWSVTTSLCGACYSSRSKATAVPTSARSRSLDMEETASRLIRSSSLRCSVNFNSWYSGDDPSLVNRRFTQPVSPVFDTVCGAEAIVFFLIVQERFAEMERVGGRRDARCQNGERGAEQDEKAAPAGGGMIQPMLGLVGSA